jgi:hypothetical protein
MKINYCLVTLNRLDELQTALRKVSPYVDKTIVIDGASEDGTIEWLSSDECKLLKVEYKVSKQYRYMYGNHTPTERNQYLDMVDPNDTWVLVTDTDEWLEEKACKELYTLAIKAEKLGYNNIGFRAHDRWTYEDGQLYDNLSNYHHHSMFFKAAKGMKYEGHTHSHLVRPGIQNKWIPSDYVYHHTKTEKALWRNSTYLWWTTSKTADNVTDSPVWLDFHSVMKKYNHLDWHEFNKLMTKGNLDQEIKDWFIAHKDSENPEAASYFIWYFIFLHPEENIKHLSSERYNRYTWNYLELAKRIKGV